MHRELEMHGWRLSTPNAKWILFLYISYINANNPLFRDKTTNRRHECLAFIWTNWRVLPTKNKSWYKKPVKTLEARRTEAPVKAKPNESIDQGEAIANARLGQQQARFGGIGFQLVAQVANVNPQDSGFLQVICAPNLAQNVPVS